MFRPEHGVIEAVGPGVRQQRRPAAEVVADARGLDARSAVTGAVDVLAEAVRFVDGYPSLDAIAEQREAHERVVLEVSDGQLVRPSAQVLDGLGQVPVVKGHDGIYSFQQQGIDQVVVVSDTVGVQVVGGAVREEPRPRQGEPPRSKSVSRQMSFRKQYSKSESVFSLLTTVDFCRKYLFYLPVEIDADGFEQLNIRFPQMIGVAGYVAVAMVPDAFRMVVGETVPYTFSFPFRTQEELLSASFFLIKTYRLRSMLLRFDRRPSPNRI